MIFIFKCILHSTQLHTHNKSIALPDIVTARFSFTIQRAQLIYLPEALKPQNKIALSLEVIFIV